MGARLDPIGIELIKIFISFNDRSGSAKYSFYLSFLRRSRGAGLSFSRNNRWRTHGSVDINPLGKL